MFEDLTITQSALEEDELCPLCCEDLELEDHLFPITCPTSGCEFNYCRACIAGLKRASEQPYELASDGSKQVKVRQQCPQCRGRYHSQSIEQASMVSTVLLLREAYRIQEVQDRAQRSDNELSAVDRRRLDRFCQSTSINDLQDALYSWEVYHCEIGKSVGDVTIPVLDFETLSSILPETLPQDYENQSASQPCDHKTLAQDDEHVSAPPLSSALPMARNALLKGLTELIRNDENYMPSILNMCYHPGAGSDPAHL